MTKVINFVGAPSVGKSTTALGVSYALKKRRKRMEYVNEFAKDVTWRGIQKLLENQTYIFAEQFHRQFALLGQVEYIVTDSPLMLSCVYHDYAHHKLAAPDYLKTTRDFYLATYKQFDNITYLVEHGVRPFDPVGRNQTADEAAQVHADVIKLLDTEGIPYSKIRPEDDGVVQVLSDLGIPVLPAEAQIAHLERMLADMRKLLQVHLPIDYPNDYLSYDDIIDADIPKGNGIGQVHGA